MKIAVLGVRGFPKVQGGVEAHCENLYPLLAKKGCEVTVFARRPYVASANAFSHNGVRLIPLSCPKGKFLEAWAHTLKGIFQAKKIRPDILHIHAIGPSFFALFARFLKMKVVITHHGPDYKRKKWGRFAKLFLKFSEYLGCRFSDGVIFVAGNIPAAAKMKGRTFAIIPNGVMPVTLEAGQNMLRHYALKKGKYVLAVGRFVPEKGFTDLIEAFELAVSTAQKDLRDWKLAIVGAADHEDSYSRHLKERALSNKRVILTGFLSGADLRELYSNAGVFVLPSYYEGAPIVLLEAMEYGLSCVASDIEANKTAGLTQERFFKPGDIQALKERIIQFCASPLSEAEIQKQKSLIRENYDWEKISQETLRFYKKVIGNGYPKVL